MTTSEGCASVADVNGNLLFYTDVTYYYLEQESCNYGEWNWFVFASNYNPSGTDCKTNQLY